MFSLTRASNLLTEKKGETVQIHREWKSFPSTTLAFQKRTPFLKLQVERILEGGLGPFVNQAINEFLGAKGLWES